jgi:ABC-type sugar transport system permease subunit
MEKEYRLFKNRNIKGWLFCSQTVIAIIVTIIYPLVFSFILSLTDLRLNLNNFKFIGLDNYLWVFTKQSGFFKALGVSVSFSVVSTLLQTFIGFLIAVMLYFMKGKLQNFYKVMLYLPVILPGALISAMWIIMYSGDEYGVLNILFSMTDPPFQWMGDIYISFISIIITNTWRYLGITMVIYFVNMNAVSKDIIESANLDGANKFMIMAKIIFPLTWSATTVNILLSMIGGIKSFDLFYLFQQNANLSIELTPVSVLIFRAGLGNSDVSNIRLARSVTMSIVLMLILTAITLFVNKAMSKRGD